MDSIGNLRNNKATGEDLTSPDAVELWKEPGSEIRQDLGDILKNRYLPDGKNIERYYATEPEDWKIALIHSLLADTADVTTEESSWYQPHIRSYKMFSKIG